MSEHDRIESFFRRESGRLVATLARQFGPAQLDLAEDVAQEALLRALKSWSIKGVPENPAAWLTSVAKNIAVDALRRRKSETPLVIDVAAFEREEEGDRLALMFACCHPSLPLESQVALTLHMLGGMSSAEIAGCLLSRPNSVEQRVSRAKRQLRQQGFDASLPHPAELVERLDSVLLAVYQVFGAGYAAHAGTQAVRIDLCADAIYLLELVLAEPATNLPQTQALMAVLLFLAARIPARTDDLGSVLRLEHQNRSQWDRTLTSKALSHFGLSIAGESVSRYHFEAAILSEHARSDTFDQTDWPKIRDLYDDLYKIEPSGIVALNRAIAIGLAEGATAGIDALRSIRPQAGLTANSSYHAALGRFQLELGQEQMAKGSFQRAAELASNSVERERLASFASF